MRSVSIENGGAILRETVNRLNLCFFCPAMLEFEVGPSGKKSKIKCEGYHEQLRFYVAKVTVSEYPLSDIMLVAMLQERYHFNCALVTD